MFIFSFGRKYTLIVGAFPMIIGWVLILFAHSVTILYISRFFIGFSDGCIYTNVAPMYLGEIASDKIRGSVLVISSIMGNIGVLYVFAIAPYVSIYTMAWYALIPPILFLITFIWAPESPYYLISKNRLTDARNCLVKLRGHSNVDDELKQMQLIVEQTGTNKTTLKDIFTRGNRKSFIIMLGLACAIQLVGCEVAVLFSELIFKKIGENLLGSSETNILFAIIFIITTSIASYAVEKLGRRLLLMWSLVGITITHATVAIYFFLKRNNIDVTHITWIPTLAVLLFIACAGIGLIPITFTLLGEIFCNDLKSTAGGAFTVFFSCFGFIAVELFQYISDNVGSDVTFAGMTVFSIFFIWFVWFLVPETKGKSFDVILKELNGHNS